jgi:hypothetical protein
MHHDRRWRQARFLDVITYLLDHIEVQRLLSLELVRAVAGADRGRERIAFRLFNELDRLLRVSQTGVPFIDFDILINAAQHSQFGFHADAFWMRTVDHPFCDGNVLVERLMARVDHDRAVKARVDAVVAGFFISMIEMDREDGLWVHLLGCANHAFEHAFVGIFSGALRELDDKRGPTLDISAKEAEQLFHVVDVVGAHGEFAVGDFVKLSSGDNHRLARRYRSSPDNERVQNLLPKF